MNCLLSVVFAPWLVLEVAEVVGVHEQDARDAEDLSEPEHHVAEQRSLELGEHDRHQDLGDLQAS